MALGSTPCLIDRKAHPLPQTLRREARKPSSVPRRSVRQLHMLRPNHAVKSER